jgi:CMP-N,N'-diacetyllegionaminic acid synthase
MRVLTIIPARSGSKRCPGKNWEKVGGKTLVERAVECANGADLLPVIVTDETDRCAGLNATALREPEELARDSVGMNDVVAWAQRQVDPTHERFPIVLIQPTSPFRYSSDILGCLRMFNHGVDFDSVVSVVGVKEGKHVRYEHNGAVYVFPGSNAMFGGSLICGRVGFYVMPPERSIDIDTPEDLAEARRLAGG